jgi:SET domain-containing protein
MKMKRAIKLSELLYVADSTIHGKGLFARRAICQGDYLGSYKGPYVSPLNYYRDTGGPHVLWIVEESGIIRGRDGRNILRYLNHHEEPSAEFDGFELFALRDIERGGEVTIHYGEEFVAAIAQGC